MQAIILAGGKGTRLKPYTATFPKPLMPIDDMPIIEIVIRQLAKTGFDRITITTGHLAEMMRLFCGDGSKWGVRIDYSNEDQPLGTAGPLTLVSDGIDENFLVMNGDLLTTLDYAELFARHCERKSLATVSVYPRQVRIDFGVIERDPDGAISRYIEKPTYDFHVSMGVNVFNRRIFEHMERNQRLDIPELITRLRQAGERIDTFERSCHWLDIGRADDYQAAADIFVAHRELFLPQ